MNAQRLLLAFVGVCVLTAGCAQASDAIVSAPPAGPVMPAPPSPRASATTSTSSW